MDIKVTKNRVIQKRKNVGDDSCYDFLGDLQYGVWSGKSFRVRGEALLRMPNIVWLPELSINGKNIYWPYVESQPSNFQILKYREYDKFSY